MKFMLTNRIARPQLTRATFAIVPVLTLAAFVLTALYPVAARPDTLYLEDGDRLTGSLIVAGQGSLSFRTHLAGKVFVPMAEVRGLSTDDPMLITLEDGKIYTGKLQYKTGNTVVVGRSGVSTSPLDLHRVSEITRLPAQSVVLSSPIDEGRSPGPEISLEVGYRFRTGAQKYQGISTQIKAQHETEHHFLSAKADVELVGDDPALDRFFDAEARGVGRTDHEWYPEFIVEFERNRNKALEFRSDITLGLGRNLAADQRQRLQAFAGLGLAVERFDAAPLRRDQNKVIANEQRVSEEELNLTLAFQYSIALAKEIELYESFVARPSLTDPGDLRAEFESVLLVPLTMNLKVKLDLLIDYEDDAKYQDIDFWTTRFGASIRFDF